MDAEAIRTHPLPGPLPTAAEPAIAVVRRLRELGHQAYLVGGAVRDLMLGIRPGDFDVATDATPAAVQAAFPRTHAVGAAFGVIVVMSGDVPVETATFRTEGPYADARHPDAVRLAGTVASDARRRDFTVNALYLDPLAGEILDPVGGVGDCARRTLRTVGDPGARLSEDALRLLRAARVAAQCALSVDPTVRAAMAAHREGIRRISAERIGHEIELILTGPAPADALELLSETGLLALILPEVEAMRGVPQPPEYHPEGDVWTHTLLMFRHAQRDRTLVLSLAILLHDVAKPLTLVRADRLRFHGHERLGAQMTAEIGRRLRLAQADVDAAADLVAQHLRFLQVRHMRPATLKRFLRQPDFREHLELHRLDCLASNGDLTNHEFCLAKLAEMSAETLAPPPLLRGRDLLDMGYAAGPLLGRILQALETAQLDGEIATPEEATAWVRERFPPDTGGE